MAQSLLYQLRVDLLHEEEGSMSMTEIMITDVRQSNFLKQWFEGTFQHVLNPDESTLSIRNTHRI